MAAKETEKRWVESRHCCCGRNLWCKSAQSSCS